MLQLSVSFYVSPETDHAALSDVLAQLAALTANRLLVTPTPVPQTPAAAAAAEVADPSAPVLPGPGSAEQPKRGRGRPRKDGQPPVQSAGAPATAVQGVAADPSHDVTPPSATPTPATKVAKPTAAKTNAELEAELFGDSGKGAPAATLEQLQVAMRASVEKNGAEATKDVFLAAGYGSLSEVPAEAYGTMVAKLQA